MLKLLQQIYTMGFRLISHEVNSAVRDFMHSDGYRLATMVLIFPQFVTDSPITTSISSEKRIDYYSDHLVDPCSQMGKGNQGYHSCLEAVFMKDNVWNFLDD